MPKTVQNLFALVEWEGENRSSVIPLKNIQNKKEGSFFETGERVSAKCVGFRGFYFCKIIAINGKLISFTLLFYSTPIYLIEAYIYGPMEEFWL